MDEDTGIGGPSSRFPTTRLSAVAGVRSPDATERQRAHAALISGYWKPVYKHLRLRWRKPNEEAKDLTQAFFARALEKDFFTGFDPARARFRTFLRTCLDRFLANEEASAQRLKRGGDVTLLPLDFEEADAELARLAPVDANALERLFDEEWVRSLFAQALEDLRQSCEARGRRTHLQLFERYDLVESPSERPTYAALAAELGLKVTDVTNYLAAVRRELRALVLERLREMTATDEEFRSEARLVLGVDAP